MKKTLRIVSVFLAVLILFMNTATAVNDGIMPLGDDRIGRVTNAISNPSGKKLNVSYSITCYGSMKSLGASRIRFFKKNSDGDYTAVKTFWKEDYSSMYTSNKTYYSSSINYNASSSGTYYAKVTFYATDSSGTSSSVLDTKKITI